jgi:hypothetical protein
MWQGAPLSTIHPISSPYPPLPTLENRVTKENSMSYLEAKSSMVAVAADVEGYLGKWSPCAYESLSTKGEDYYPCTLLYDSNFTLT